MRTGTRAPQSAAVLCGRAAALVADDHVQVGIELYREVIDGGDPEWAPFAALVAGNLLAEHGDTGAAARLFRTAIASGHEVFAVSASFALAALEQDEPAFAPEPRGSRVAVDPLPTLPARPAFVVARNRAAGFAAAAVLAAGGGIGAIAVHRAEVADAAAVLARAERIEGTVIQRGPNGWDVRYVLGGSRVISVVEFERPDGSARPWQVGDQVEWLRDTDPGSALVLADDLEHPEQWYSAGGVVLCLLVAAGCAAGAGVQAQRWRRLRVRASGRGGGDPQLGPRIEGTFAIEASRAALSRSGLDSSLHPVTSTVQLPSTRTGRAPRR